MSFRSTMVHDMTSRTEFASFGCRIVRQNLFSRSAVTELTLMFRCSFLRDRIAASHRSQEKLSVNGRRVSRDGYSSTSDSSAFDSF